jgi:hypothetical protein
MSSIKNPARIVKSKQVGNVLEAESNGASLDEMLSLAIEGRGKA